MAGEFWLSCCDAVALMRSMPSKSVQLISTDIAYESLEKHRAVGTTTRLKVSKSSSNQWFEIFKNDRLDELFAEFYRVLDANSHLYFYCDFETARIASDVGERHGFKLWNVLDWVKVKGTGGVSNPDNMEPSDPRIGMGYHWRKCKEHILFFEKGKRKLNDLGLGDVIPCPPVRGKDAYPTEKPVELNKLLVSNSTQPGEIVFDPFMGSGSCGNAAIRLGRRFIGGDIKQEAVDLARRKLVGAGGTEAMIVTLRDQPPPQPPVADEDINDEDLV
jgi:site-specific DNA-methyltransferase (adenine-specific)